MHSFGLRDFSIFNVLCNYSFAIFKIIKMANRGSGNHTEWTKIVLMVLHNCMHNPMS